MDGDIRKFQLLPVVEKMVHGAHHLNQSLHGQTLDCIHAVNEGLHFILRNIDVKGQFPQCLLIGHDAGCRSHHNPECTDIQHPVVVEQRCGMVSDMSWH